MRRMRVFRRVRPGLVTDRGQRGVGPFAVRGSAADHSTDTAHKSLLVWRNASVSPCRVASHDTDIRHPDRGSSHDDCRTGCLAGLGATQSFGVGEAI
jgi:hypothetical protein